MHPLVTLEFSRIRTQELLVEAAEIRRTYGALPRPAGHGRTRALLRSVGRLSHWGRHQATAPCPPNPRQA